MHRYAKSLGTNGELSPSGPASFYLVFVTLVEGMRSIILSSAGLSMVNFVVAYEVPEPEVVGLWVSTSLRLSLSGS